MKTFGKGSDAAPISHRPARWPTQRPTRLSLTTFRPEKFFLKKFFLKKFSRPTTFAAGLLLAAWMAGSGLWSTRPLLAETPIVGRAIRSEKDVIYGEVGGRKLVADVYRPDGDQLCPGVLLIHGGAWSSGNKWNMSDHARELAQEGYVAIAINYRLAPACKYPAQIEDCRAALRWIEQVADRFKIDTGRLGVYGYSAGGHLAAMLATDRAEGLPRLKAAVAGGAPCDLSFIPKDSLAISHVLGGTRAQIPLVYRDASPLTYASSDDCPMFFFHGDQDLIVPPQASRVLCQRLDELGVETCYYSVESHGHLVTFIHPEARRAAIEFLNKHLQQGH